MDVLNATLVQDWILREMRAEGLVDYDHTEGRYLFYGDKTVFEITVTATPVRENTTRLREPAPELGGSNG